MNRFSIALLRCAIAWLAIDRVTFAAPAGTTPPTTAVSVEGNSFQKIIRPFLETHCFDCHDDSEQKGGLRLDDLVPDFTKPAIQQTWIDVFDKVSTDEMPPKKKPRPPEPQKQQLLSWLKDGITAADLATRKTDGRVVLRRLNRNEYENTVRDLLGIDVDLKDLLPEDTSSMGFDNVADALNVSSVLMERYLEAADAALDAAIQIGQSVPARHWDVAYGVVTKNPNDYRLKGGVTSLPDGTFVMFNSGDSPIVCDRFSAPSDGHYRIRVHAYAYRSPAAPLVMGILAGSFDARSSRRRTVGFYDLPPDAANPRVIEFTESLPVKGTLKIQTYGLGRHGLDKPELLAAYTGPGVAISKIEVDGPIVETSSIDSHNRLFGSLDLQTASAADVERVLVPFASRAFRRPAKASDIESELNLVKSRIEAGEQFLPAIRVGLKAILCSPEFLFLREQPGRLDDYAVASRLSYFLWSSMPDDELTKLAASHMLTHPDVLHAQTERMLSDRRARAFTQDFVGQWLGLRQINATTPDKRLYPGFDDVLQWSMVEETMRFFDELLARDLALSNFIDSDFSMLNAPLAELYGIDGVHGTDFRKVALPPGCHRGGLLAQASVLKVTANGTITSPVVRGAWVMRNILGRPPKPPPPNIPAIEPDTRGATTIRELLAKHSSQASCAACHAKIDPPGFAMENFDVIGGWRENYHTFGGSLTVRVRQFPKRGDPKVFPKLDSSGVFPNGREFQDFDQFKKLLLDDKDQVARCLTEKLLIYSTGSGLDFADRPDIDQILQQTRAHGYGLRTLVDQVVQSNVFLNK